MKFEGSKTLYSRKTLESLCPMKGPPLTQSMKKPYDEKRKAISKCLNLENLWVPKYLRRSVGKSTRTNVDTVVISTSNGGVLDSHDVDQSLGWTPKSIWINTQNESKKKFKDFDKKRSLLIHMVHVLASSRVCNKTHRILERILRLGCEAKLSTMKSMVSFLARKCVVRFKLESQEDIAVSSKPRVMRRKKTFVLYEGIKLPLWERIPRAGLSV